MSEELANPLLSLIKERELIDDLQYEEVAGEFRRSGTPVFQILQDSGILDADTILQVMAEHLGTEVVSLRNRDLPAEVINSIPANAARTSRCIPVEADDSTVKVAFEDPLDPARVDELAFVAKKDIQVVVANPVEIAGAIDK